MVILAVIYFVYELRKKDLYIIDITNKFINIAQDNIKVNTEISVTIKNLSEMMRTQTMLMQDSQQKLTEVLTEVKFMRK